MITVACVWVKANVPFEAAYVGRLHAMVTRHLPTPFRFVCLTDRPAQLPAGVEAIRIPSIGSLFGWWAKLQLFNEAHGFTGRMLYLDLDTLVLQSLLPIVEYPSPFALVPHAGTFNGKKGLSVVKRFNSSVMAWDAGVNDHLFADWSPAVAARLFGDQDWIGERTEHGEKMPLEWFPRISEIGAGPVPAAAKVVLCKKPKNTVAATQWPWVAEVWQ